MITLGITGGIGAGKSAMAGFLAAEGIPVLDTDQVARDLVKPGCPALAAIVEAFGPAVLDPQGALDRAVLGRRVFQDAAARATLEALLHPRIEATWTGWLLEAPQQQAPLCAVVIPLLYEKGYADRFGSVVAVACSVATQLQRLRQRDWSDESIQGRLAAQWSMAEKLQRAHFGLWSEGCLEVLHDQIRCVIRSLRPA